MNDAAGLPPDMTNDDLRNAIAKVSFEATGALLAMRKMIAKLPGWPEVAAQSTTEIDDFASAVGAMIDVVEHLQGFADV